MSDRSKFKNLFKAALVASALLLTAAGCTNVSEGHMGLEKTRFTGTYRDTLLTQGLSGILTVSIEDIATHQINLDIKNLQPKDKDNVLLKEMDITVIFRLNTKNPKVIVDYIRETNDLRALDGGDYMVGSANVSRIASGSVQSSMHEFSSQEALQDRPKLNAAIEKKLQADLDVRYPNVFIVDAITTYSVQVAPFIENRIQQIAGAHAITATNTAQLETIASTEALLTKQMASIKSAAEATGMTVDQVLHAQFLAHLTRTEGIPAASEATKVVVGPDGTSPGHH